MRRSASFSWPRASLSQPSPKLSQASRSVPRAPSSDHIAISKAPVSEPGHQADAVVLGQAEQGARALEQLAEPGLGGRGAVRAADQRAVQAGERPAWPLGGRPRAEAGCRRAQLRLHRGSMLSKGCAREARGNRSMRAHLSPAISTVNVCFTAFVHSGRDACRRDRQVSRPGFANATVELSRAREKCRIAAAAVALPPLRPYIREAWCGAARKASCRGPVCGTSPAGVLPLRRTAALSSGSSDR